MPTFKFYGRDATGKSLSGKRLAHTADSLGAQLQQEGITPVHILEIKKGVNYWEKLKDYVQGGALTLEELSLFARQMHTLSKTGVPITLAIKQLAENARSATMTDTLNDIVESLESGQDLAEAIGKHPNIFSPLMVSMVRIGQNTGRLDEAFLHLGQYIELESLGKKRIANTMRYPIFILLTIFAGIILINIYVIPTFAEIYQRANLKLPMLTVILISISNFMVHYARYLAVFFCVVIGLFFWYLHTPKGKLEWSNLVFKIPVFGEIQKRVILLRFAETFALTIRSGVPLLDGLGLSADSIDNQFAKQEINAMREAIQRGSSLTQAAFASTLFTPLELQMLAVSEQTGELPLMLEQIAAFYRRETEYDVKRINDLLEPTLLIIMSVFILMLALAVYLPIWDMVKLVHA